MIFIIGVSGCGKSTIGKLLAQELKIPFFDGDDFHTEVNIKKMSNGQALNDNDRQVWLEVLNNLAKKQLAKNSCVIVCSALKQKYRNTLSEGVESETKWVHLKGSFNQIFKRVNSRSDHFMTSELLHSQFDILENPKNAIQIDISLTPENIIKTIKHELMTTSEFGLGIIRKTCEEI